MRGFVSLQYFFGLPKPLYIIHVKKSLLNYMKFNKLFVIIMKNTEKYYEKYHEKYYEKYHEIVFTT